MGTVEISDEKLMAIIEWAYELTRYKLFEKQREDLYVSDQWFAMPLHTLGLIYVGSSIT